MSSRRAVRSYVVEAILTVVLVGGIATLMLNRHLPDQTGMQAEVVPPTAPEAVDRDAEPPDGTWRDDFDNLAHWVSWAGHAEASGEGLLALRDPEGTGTIILQKRPLLFETADIEMLVRSDGGVVSMGVAAAGEGPITELSGNRGRCAPADGIALDVDFGSSTAGNGRLRWMRDGGEMLSVVTQQRPLPRGEFSTVNVNLSPQRCVVALNGQEAGEIVIPWREDGYRLYLGAQGGNAEVDYLALTVPRIPPGSAIGAIGPRLRPVRPGTPLLTARVVAALTGVAR